MSYDGHIPTERGAHRDVVEDGIFGLAPVDAGPEPARFAGCFMWYCNH